MYSNGFWKKLLEILQPTSIFKGTFIRTCQLRNLSKQINNVIFYSSNNFIKLDPWFLTGFTDGEGSFIISIINNKERKIGYSVKLFFQIGLHQKDLNLLLKIQSFFGVGKNLYKKR